MVTTLMAADARIAPDPGQGWSRQLAVCSAAVIIPPSTAALRQKTGVLDRYGLERADAATWRYDRPITLPPDPAPPRAHLTGRWLWAGSLYNHFGHFLVESLSRLWAVEAAASIDGILYVPKRPRQAGSLATFQKDLLLAFGIDIEVHIARNS